MWHWDYALVYHQTFYQILVCALLSGAKVLGASMEAMAPGPLEFKGILFTWILRFLFRKESITEKIWEIFY